MASSCIPLPPLALGFPGRWMADIPLNPRVICIRKVPGMLLAVTEVFFAACAVIQPSTNSKHPALQSWEAPQSHRAAFGSTKSRC